MYSKGASNRGRLTMGEKHENSNLASEFYVLSMLYRKGFNASLTLGNKKSVDILIIKNDKIITIDVKGLLVKNVGSPISKNKLVKLNHYYVIVAYEDITNHKTHPEVYVIPSVDLDLNFKELENYPTKKGKLLCYYVKSKRSIVDLNRLRKLSKKYKDKWELLE
jgi:hypothetical protein